MTNVQNVDQRLAQEAMGGTVARANELEAEATDAIKSVRLIEPEEK